MPTLILTTEIELFNSYFQVGDATECWNWTGPVGTHGYGQLHLKKQGTKTSHTVAYRIHKGVIPKGYVIRHTCDNKKCVNPDHLVLGTYKQNHKEAIERGLTKDLTGEANHSAILTEEQVIEIRNRYRRYKKAGPGASNSTDLAKEFGVGRHVISMVVLRKRWKHLP